MAVGGDGLLRVGCGGCDRRAFLPARALDGDNRHFLVRAANLRRVPLGQRFLRRVRRLLGSPLTGFYRGP